MCGKLAKPIELINTSQLFQYNSLVFVDVEKFENSTQKKLAGISKKNKVAKSNHQKLTKSYECAICQKVFTRNDSLQIHMRSHTGERPFKCQFCIQRFIRKFDMKAHERTHTGETPYQCEMCTFTSRTRQALNKHIKTSHPM